MNNHLPGSVIAVVDDDPGILASLEGLLQSMDCTVHTFGSAETLLQSGRLEEFDCVITDIGLPELNGFELLQAIHAQRQALPVIFMTGQHDRREQWPPLTAQPYRLFKKPFHCQDMLVAVDNAIRDSSGDSSEKNK